MSGHQTSELRGQLPFLATSLSGFADRRTLELSSSRYADQVRQLGFCLCRDGGCGRHGVCVCSPACVYSLRKAWFVQSLWCSEIKVCILWCTLQVALGCYTAIQSILRRACLHFFVGEVNGAEDSVLFLPTPTLPLSPEILAQRCGTLKIKTPLTREVCDIFVTRESEDLLLKNKPNLAFEF